MDPFESRDKIPRTPPGQSFVNKSLVTDTEAGLNCSTYESGSRRSFADRTPEKHTLALRNSGTAWERYQNMSLPIIGNSTDNVKSPRRTPPPTVIRRDRSCKRPHSREEYSSFISLERNMVLICIHIYIFMWVCVCWSLFLFARLVCDHFTCMDLSPLIMCILLILYYI
nr:unnamed protein product [Trichobilharzia regenti]